MKMISFIFKLINITLRISYLWILSLILFTSIEIDIFAQEKIDSLKSSLDVSPKNEANHKTIVNKRNSLIQENLLPFITDDSLHFNLSKNFIEDKDYRVFSDVFYNYNFLHQKNLSSFGTPNYLTYYNQSSENISILQDGIELNNRFYYSFDINNLLSENVSKVELIPISRSFLFSNSNHAVINFASFKPETQKPFSRIKFFQGDNDEGFIDAIINLTPFKNLTTYFEISNQSFEGNFKNSEYSNWKGTFCANYNLLNNLNIAVSYYRQNSSVSLNGGIDADSINKLTSQFNFDDVAFDNILSPVRFSNRYQSFIIDRLTLKFSKKLASNNLTELTFFYQHDKNFYRQNSIGELQSNIFPIKRENFSLTKGFYLKSNYSYENYNFFVSSNFERNQFNSQILKKENSLSYFNISSGINFNVNNFVTPTFFGKFLSQAQNIFYGIGSDVVLKFSSSTKFYFGYSLYKKPFNFQERRFVLNKDWNDFSNIQTFETKLLFNNSLINFELGYFVLTNDNFLLPAFIYYDYKNDDAYYVKSINSKSSAVNFNFALSFWNLTFENRFTYNFYEEERINRGLPLFENNASLFYSNVLFNNNLKLKTGFEFYTIGKRYEQRFDFEKGISSTYIIFLNNNSIKQISNKNFSTSLNINLFLIADIQNSAKVYVTLENLLDAKYYYVPYFPTYPRNLRIGVAWNFLD